MRVAVEYRTASKENYLRFKKAHPEENISFELWQQVIYGFNQAFRDYLLKSGDKEKLPYGFGNFAVCKKKLKRYKTLPDGSQKINLNVDWQKTRQHGKYIYHLNDHTEGYNFYWRWEPHSARFIAREIWRFKPSRETSRLLAQYLRQGEYQHLYKEWK